MATATVSDITDRTKTTALKNISGTSPSIDNLSGNIDVSGAITNYLNAPYVATDSGYAIASGTITGYSDRASAESSAILGVQNKVTALGLDIDSDNTRDKAIDYTAKYKTTIGEAGTQSGGAAKTDSTAAVGSNIIESGTSFNRGNDPTTTAAATDTTPAVAADTNSSMVLDRSMYLNTMSIDILNFRGGSGVKVNDSDGTFSYA